jgi:hypothetical protein
MTQGHLGTMCQVDDKGPLQNGHDTKAVKPPSGCKTLSVEPRHAAH